MMGETRPLHEFAVTLDQRQPWGTMQVGMEWSQYLHDLSKYRLEVEGELSFRITRGLSVEIEGSASRIRDQLSLPRRGADPEEILLRLRELQSGYEVEPERRVQLQFRLDFQQHRQSAVWRRGRGWRGWWRRRWEQQLTQ